ncbi:hypothetical protein PG993_000391 [Apiospora rasikravindrae]|uniref:Ankyrin n=1 Tax=Apiospora rasikravindrae TaxID=990691 RepID=A0ABR1U8H1_9PEZI
MHAVSKNHIQVAQLLFDQGAATDIRSFYGENLLHVAARFGAVRCFVYFHQLGCDAAQTDLRGNTPWHHAMHLDHLRSYCLNGRLLESLIAPESVNVLSSLIVQGRCGAIRHVLRSFPRKEAARLANKKAGAEMTPLCLAVEHNCPRCVATLLAFGADPEVQGSREGTPLMQACAFGQVDMLRILSRHGASLWQSSVDPSCGSGTNRSAVDAARQCQDAVRWLLVERFQEQGRLTADESCSEPGAEVLRGWAGPRALEYRWWMYHKMDHDGSSLSRLRGWTKVKGEVQGSVIQGQLYPVVEEKPTGDGNRF